ncbi:MAG: hypothetical protein EOP06_20745 [Proteobacteria bacterium]|nr:MAG: hypothetical protein EOP06_20745 [Pseudomonadota bacterium]
MKLWSFLSPVYFAAAFFSSPEPKQCLSDGEHFHLTYSTIGFGSNFFSQQPFFRVSKGKFIYSMEDAWVHPDEPVRKPDTLVEGSVRQSSIDSFRTIISGIHDSTIYKSSRMLSGTRVEIRIEVDNQRVGFTLWNESDSRAEEIVMILNSYIPETIRPLTINGISNSNK